MELGKKWKADEVSAFDGSLEEKFNPCTGIQVANIQRRFSIS
jgi:hypothetical protein